MHKKTNNRSSITREQNERIIALHRQGVSNIEISALLDMQPSTVSWRMRKLGIPSKRQSSGNFWIEAAPKIIALHHEGKDPATIAALIGRPERSDTITYKLRQAGYVPHASRRAATKIESVEREVEEMLTAGMSVSRIACNLKINVKQLRAFVGRRALAAARRQETLQPLPNIPSLPTTFVVQAPDPLNLRPALTCQWIEGEVFRAEHMCGVPSVRGKSYCEEHAARAFVGVKQNQIVDDPLQRG